MVTERGGGGTEKNMYTLHILQRGEQSNEKREKQKQHAQSAEE